MPFLSPTNSVRSLREEKGATKYKYTKYTCQVTASKLKVVILIPVFQWQRRQRCCVGKLKISEVPVENLPVTRGQVNITNHITVNDISFSHSITYTMHSDQGYITGETMPIGCRVMASGLGWVFTCRKVLRTSALITSASWQPTGFYCWENPVPITLCDFNFMT